jgi:hypothetical protein
MDTFGKGIAVFGGLTPDNAFERGLRSFLKITDEPPNSRLEYDISVFDGLGDGNMFWSETKGYDTR